MRKADMTSGAILIGLSGLVAIGTLELPYWPDVTPGPAFAARWVALVGAVLGIILFWQAAGRGEEFPIEWPEPAGTRSVVYACGLLWLFCLSLPFAGFVTSGAVFMMAMLVGVQRMPVWPSALATLITIAGGYGIFIKWLQVKLPLGPLGI